MRRIQLDKKTGFVNNSNIPIVIYDDRMKPFYDTKWLSKQPKKFNLPSGIYNVKRGFFSSRVAPIYYELFELPENERNFDKPDDFKVIFANNPNKCTISWGLKTIIYDTKYLRAPLPEIMFIFFHEMGHHKYTTEHFCDLYAVNEMLKRGYNPSQIGKVEIESLSNKQLPRKEYITNKLTNQFS